MKAKFIEISDALIEQIKSGIFQPGDKLPSENDLIKTHQISNTTARKIHQAIELKGWAKRMKGKGTFVLNRTADHRIIRTLGSIHATRRGFHEGLIAEGFTPKSIVLEKTILPEGISSEIAGRHFIIEGPVMKIHQLRYADDELVKDETKYISVLLCPRIVRMPNEVSYFKVYESTFHLKIREVTQTYSVEIMTSKTPGNNFEVEQPIPVFILDSAVICHDERVVELERSFYRGDKYKFSISANPSYDDTTAS